MGQSVPGDVSLALRDANEVSLKYLYPSDFRDDWELSAI
jgi:hypothetical protein